MHKADIHRCISKLWKHLKEQFPKFLLHIKPQSHFLVLWGFVHGNNTIQQGMQFSREGGRRQMQTVKSYIWGLKSQSSILKACQEN